MPQAAFEIRLATKGEPLFETIGRLLDSGNTATQFDRARAEVAGAILQDGQVMVAAHASLTSATQASLTPWVIIDAVESNALAALFQQICGWIDRQGVVVTTYLGQVEAAAAAAIEGVGFKFVTELEFYSCHALRIADVQQSAVEFQTLEDSSRLERLVRQTSVGSGDLPELMSTWTVDSMLADEGAEAHRYAANHQGDDVGMLALEFSDSICRVSFLGVRPQWRRRGFARAMLQETQRLARAARCEQIILSVDQRNEPAIRLYESAGFLKYGRRPLYCRSNTVS